MGNRVLPIRTYLTVCAALLVLTLMTLGASTLDLGPWNTVIALAIAGCKALLILLYFMHLRYSPRLTVLVLLAGLLWLGILMVGTMDDMVTRGWLNVPGK